MDKLKYVKIENEDGSLSDNIPLGVDAENVDVTSAGGSQNLADYISVNDGKINSINSQIDDLQDNNTSLSNQIKSLSSGSPKGSYTTVSELKTANPDTGVYIIQEDGHIYSWIKDSSKAVDLGIYQAIKLANNSVSVENIKELDKIIMGDENYYITIPSNLDGLKSWSCNIKNRKKEYTFSFSDEAHISGSDLAGVDIWINTAQSKYLDATSLNIGIEIEGYNSNKIIIFYPQDNFSSFVLSSLNNNYFFARRALNSLSYHNLHKDELLQIRVAFNISNFIDQENKIIKIKNIYSFYEYPNFEINKNISIHNDLINTFSFYNDIKSSVPNALTGLNKEENKISFIVGKASGLSWTIKINPNSDLHFKCDEIKDQIGYEKYPLSCYCNIELKDKSYIYKAYNFSDNEVVFPSSYFNSYKDNMTGYAKIVLTPKDIATSSEDDYKREITIINPRWYQINANGDSISDFLNNLISSKLVNRLYGKSMLVMGDSMAYGHTLDRKLVWDSLIAKRNNMILTNVSQNGKFITRNIYDDSSPGGVKEYDDPTNISNKCIPDVIDTLQNNNYDYIVCFAGTNDISKKITLGTINDNNYDTFYGALNITMQKILDKFPKSNILFITPYPVSPDNKDYSVWKNYVDAIEEVCHRNSIAVFNNNESGINNINDSQRSIYELSGVHINSIGMERVSYKYESRLLSL